MSSEGMKRTAPPPPNPEFILQSSSQINHVLFSCKEPHLFFSSNRNGDLNVYNLESRRSIFQSYPYKESILSIAELDNLDLLTHSRNGSIYKWVKNDANWKPECIFKQEMYTFCQFTLNNEKSILYVPSNQSSIIDCIELKNNSKISSLRPSDLGDSKKGMLMNLKTIDDIYILAGYECGEMCLFDLRVLKELNSVNLFNGQPLMCFDYDRSVNIGISGSSELNPKFFKIEDSKLNELNNISLNLVNPGLNTIKIRKNDARIFAMGGWDSRIRVYGLKKQKMLAVLDFHKEAINAIDFSTLNLKMAAGSNDNIISFWNLYTESSLRN